MMKINSTPTTTFKTLKIMKFNHFYLTKIPSNYEQHLLLNYEQHFHKSKKDDFGIHFHINSGICYEKRLSLLNSKLLKCASIKLIY